jgi:glucose-6-phosphate isomerase
MPFTTILESLGAEELAIERRLSDLIGSFSNPAAAGVRIAAGDDPIIYRAYEPAIPYAESHLIYRTTVLEPGDVAGEYFMTRGHHHVRDSAEFYLGLAGDGAVVMQDRTGQTTAQLMTPGTAVYIPPGWAHRTVNVGDRTLSFLSVFFGDAGHDYASMQLSGFTLRVVRGPDGRPQVVGADGAGL